MGNRGEQAQKGEGSGSLLEKGCESGALGRRLNPPASASPLPHAAVDLRKAPVLSCQGEHRARKVSKAGWEGEQGDNNTEFIHS